jgi:tyrosyl-tRNA synthetase
MTMPLLEGLDGVEKMSNTLDNFVGITEPASEIFGKIMSISDPLMFRYFELLTDEPLSQIENWRKEAKEGQVNPKDLKSRLARIIVADFWSSQEAEKAAEEFERVFKNKEIPSEIEVIEVKAAEIPLIDLMVNQKILPSRGEAKRIIRQGGVYLDGQRVEDIGLKIDLRKNAERVLKIGKKNFYKIERKT